MSWVLTAKREETRERRMAQLVEDCAAGRLIPRSATGPCPSWAARAAAAARQAAERLR